MKKQAHKLSDKEKMVTLDALYTAAGSLRGRADMKAFLRDLLTPSERRIGCATAHNPQRRWPGC